MTFRSKLNISDNDNSLDVNLALDVANFFRVEKSKAKEIVKNIHETVNYWRSVAAKYGLSRNEQELMAAAFITSV